VFVCVQRYLKALGMSRTAQVKKDARIGEAEARRDATIRVRSAIAAVQYLIEMNQSLHP